MSELPEDSSLGWPPPDPERMARRRPASKPVSAFTYDEGHLTTHQQVAAFRRRQQHDIGRHMVTPTDDTAIYPPLSPNPDRDELDEDRQRSMAMSEGPWMNGEGDCLGDFGVDEDEER